MKIQKSTIINASVDDVWAVVAHDFEKVGLWSSAVVSSGVNPDAAAPEGATVGGRVCDVPGIGEALRRIGLGHLRDQSHQFVRYVFPQRTQF